MEHHKYKLEKVHCDSPKRCQGNNKFGQCMFEQLPNSQFCLMHQGGSNYKLPGFLQAAIEEKAKSKKLTDLSEEVALVRVLLEQTLSTMQTVNDILLHSATVSELTGRIERLVLTLTRVQELQKQSLNKERVTNFVDEVLVILSECVDAAVLKNIAGRIGEIDI